MQLACAPLQISLLLLPAVLTGTQKSKHRRATNLSLSLKIMLCPAHATQGACAIGPMQVLHPSAFWTCRLERRAQQLQEQLSLQTPATTTASALVDPQSGIWNQTQTVCEQRSSSMQHRHRPVNYSREQLLSIAESVTGQHLARLPAIHPFMLRSATN